MIEVKVLDVRDEGDFYGVYGTSYVSMLTAINYTKLRATSNVLNIVENALNNNKIVKVVKHIKYDEVQERELIIYDKDDFEEVDFAKNIGKVYLDNSLNSFIVNLSAVTLISFFKAHMELLDSGVFITSENRAKKYLEIIEAAGKEEPILDGKTEEQYLEDKLIWDNSQKTLKYLENYLEGLDKLSFAEFLYENVKKAKLNIEQCSNVKEVEHVIEEFKGSINN